MQASVAWMAHGDMGRSPFVLPLVYCSRDL